MDKTILNEITSVLDFEAKKMNLELVNVKYFYSDEVKSDILEVQIDHDFEITMDEINKFTEVISPLLDTIDGLESTYMLDVCSPGSEREIKEKDLPLLVDRYLEIKKKDSNDVILAKLDNYDEESKELSLTYFIKGRKKQENLKLDDIKEIHMGYKK